MRIKSFATMLRSILIPLFFVIVLILNSSLIQAQILRIDTITFEGNRITRDKVLFREISLRTGESCSLAELDDKVKESRDNLMNTTLFNFVEPKVIYQNDSTVSVTFTLTERWYSWVTPILLYEDRNFSSWLEKRDLSRLSYGLIMTQHNLGGTKQSISVSLQGGFNQQFYLLYQNPYIDKRRMLGLEFQAGSQNLHEAAYATVESKQMFLKSGDHYLHQRVFAKGGLTFRPGLHTSVETRIGFENLNWDDTLLALNPGLTDNSVSEVLFMTLHSRIKLDFRDYASYPLNGWYADLEIVKNGLQWLGETPDEFHVKTTMRKYFKLAPKVYSAFGFHGKMSSSGPQPYYLNYGLGYLRDFARGYEYYVIDGQSYALFKGNLKFEILSPREWRIPFIVNEKFSKTFTGIYLNLQADFAYVADRYPTGGNPFANQWLYGFGPGLDVVTYYDKVLRLDYSYNHLHEGGLYIHFIAPI